MAYADLRKFIERLRSKREPAEVSAEVDWGYEDWRDRKEKPRSQWTCPPVRKIRDSSSPLFTCGLSTDSRVSLALNLSRHKRLK